MHKKLKAKAKIENILALILTIKPFFKIQLKKNRDHLKTENGF
jgi:hypothetical protein